MSETGRGATGEGSDRAAVSLGCFPSRACPRGQCICDLLRCQGRWSHCTFEKTHPLQSSSSLCRPLCLCLLGLLQWAQARPLHGPGQLPLSPLPLRITRPSQPVTKMLSAFLTWPLFGEGLGCVAF